MWGDDGLFHEFGHCLNDIHTVVGHGRLPHNSGSRSISDLQRRDNQVRREALDDRCTRAARVVVEHEDMLPGMPRKKRGWGIISVVVLYGGVAEECGCWGVCVVRTLAMGYENIIRRTGGCGGCRGSHGDAVWCPASQPVPQNKRRRW